MTESFTSDAQYEHWACGMCNMLLPDPMTRRDPCPRCGDSYHRSGWSGESRPRSSIGSNALMKVGKRRRWAVEELLEWQVDHRTGHWVKRYRLYDRRADLYVERVFDTDTGEELHSTSERLSGHVGHGSAIIKSENTSSD